MDLGRSTTTTKVRALIVMVQYYRDIWPRHSHVLDPLTEAASGPKDRKMLWNDSLESSFKECFQLQMRISFPFLGAKYFRTSLLIMRTLVFFTLLYVGGTYARLVYTWYKNIFCTIAVLIVFFAVNRKKSDLMKTIPKQDSDKIETRECYC